MIAVDGCAATLRTAKASAQNTHSQPITERGRFGLASLLAPVFSSLAESAAGFLGGIVRSDTRESTEAARPGVCALCGRFRLTMRAGVPDRCVLLGAPFLHGGAPVLHICTGVSPVQSRFGKDHKSAADSIFPCVVF